jgi:hypothetical protein
MLQYEDKAIVNFMKAGWLKCADRVVRMDQQRPAKRILNAKPGDRRKREEPKQR